MKCLIFLGFTANVFKKEPRVRCFLNENFLDEFTIKHSLESNKQEKDHIDILVPHNKFKYFTDFESIGQMLIYEVDIPNDSCVLEIEVENDDNNFSNGFMTKYTWARLEYINILPVRLTDRILKTKNDIFQKIKNRISRNPHAVKKQYVDTPRLFDNLVKYTYFVDKNKKKIYETYCQTLGKSGKYICECVKKFNSFIPKKLGNNVGYWRINKRLKFLLDKYCSDENQRDNN